MTVAAAALAGSRMIGLDAAKTTNALGIAAYLSPVAGTMRFIEARSGKVAMTKMAPAGWMAQAGLTAVLWAANGYVGDQEIFDGEPNYGKFLGMPGWKPEAFLDRLGEEWVIGDGMVYKQFPCGMPGHPILEAAIDAMRSNDIRASDVEEIVIWSTASTPIFENKKVTQQLEVQFSVPYMLALSALGIPPGVEWFDEKYMTDPEVNALMSKVHIAFNKDSNDAVAAGSRRRRWSAMVDVVAKGSTFRSEKIVAKGDPSTPETRTTDDELKQKFHFNLRHVDRADASDIADATWNLDRYAQASSVIRMFGS
jgi:2-methylcitrate dehydratase PrpD